MSTGQTGRLVLFFACHRGKEVGCRLILYMSTDKIVGYRLIIYMLRGKIVGLRLILFFTCKKVK